MNASVTDKDSERAKVCLSKCPVCKAAREKQKGACYWFVRNVEPKLNCPYCKAYEKVYGRKPYEPLTKASTQ